MSSLEKMDAVDWITISLAAIAIVISLIALWVGNRQSKRQIINDKYEEIYELVFGLYYYYSSLKELFSWAERANGKGRQEDDEEKYQEYLKRLSVQDDLYKKTARLKVLAHSYLADDLKKDVLAYNDMIEKLLIGSVQRMILLQEIYYDKGFPDYNVLHVYLTTIRQRLEEKIGLGGRFLSDEELAGHRDNVFKLKLGIK